MKEVRILSEKEIREIIREEINKKFSIINKAIDDLRIRINDLERIGR